MSEINFYLCGGTGINLGLALKDCSRTPYVKEAQFIGLDSSGNNPANDLFAIERMAGNGTKELATGSGKLRSTNYDQMEAFVAASLAKNKPARYNIIMGSTSGGTGSTLAIVTARQIIKQGKIAIMCLVSDFTSVVEANNAVGTLKGWANQVKPEFLGTPIAYLNHLNTASQTRGEVNKEIVERLNMLSLFLTEANEEMDYEDIYNLFHYNRFLSTPPALSEIRFFDQDSAKDYNGKTPVAVASLFNNRDDVIPVFEGTVYRTTGVFAEDVPKPKAIEQLHLTLDHGEALDALEKHAASLEDRRAVAQVTYVTQKDVSQGANNAGICLD